MKKRLIERKFLALSVCTLLPNCDVSRAETIWEPLSTKSEDQSLINKASKANSISLKEQKDNLDIKNISRNKYPGISWQLIDNFKSSNRRVRWEYINPEELNNLNLLDYKNETFKPSTFAEASYAYRYMKPRKEDYIEITRLSPGFPTANQLKSSYSQVNIYTISAFSGGAAGGTGNQNYAIRYDYGYSDNLQLSGYYSVADDPLFSKIKSHSTENTPNYWESYGVGFKFPIFKKDSMKIAIESSIESWNIRSGPPNIFNNSNNVVNQRSIVGSIVMPLTWEMVKDLDFNISTGYTFLPSSMGKNQGGQGTFYGNTLFIGSGISWRPITSLALISSLTFPLGPGYNSFNSDIEFSRDPIMNIGIDWNLNPRISLEGKLTNGFGATPATGLLTLPSSNRLGYYAGFKYNQDAIDSPQEEFDDRKRSLSTGGLTVNTALIPNDGTTQVWGNIDNEGNIFGYIGYSLSNSFQLDVINLGYFKNVPKKSGEKADLVRRYANDDGLKTRVGAKFILSRPKNRLPFWSALRISAGRNQDLSSRQGYLFAELINTWEMNKRIAFSINPKIAWNNVSTPKGIGLGANVQLFKRFQLIPEYNFVSEKNGDSNATIALRWLFNDSLNIDFYASTAAGLQDMGQLLSSDKPRLGARFTITY